MIKSRLASSLEAALATGIEAFRLSCEGVLDGLRITLRFLTQIVGAIAVALIFKWVFVEVDQYTKSCGVETKVVHTETRTVTSHFDPGDPSQPFGTFPEADQ